MPQERRNCVTCSFYLINMGDFVFDVIKQAIHELYVPKKSEKSGKGPKKKPGMNKTNK